MRPPYREDQPSPVVERRGDDGIVYVERTAATGNWEDRQRCRSHPHSGKLYFGSICLLLVWLSVPALVAGIIMLNQGHREPWGGVCIAAGVVMILSLVASLAITLTLKCPLCHGTPLHSRLGCHKHRLANRWFPLTYRATSVVRILFTLTFRCMYCGTPFRLFKRSSRQRG